MEPSPKRLFDLREYPILYVDDEPENLRIFELAFRRDFSILTAESGAAGLELLQSEPVALVLSDHRMPGMTGTEFLGRVRDVDPKTIRILVTAYGDAETLGQAVNDGSIYRYVAKPWEPDELRITLRRAIEAYAVDREREALVRELGTINQLARTINQELSLDRLLDLLLRIVTEQLGFDGATLLFFDEPRENLRVAGVSPSDCGLADELRRMRIETSKAAPFMRQLCAGEIQVLEMENLDHYSAPIRSWVTEVAAEQLVVVPLVGKKGTIGALAVDNRRGGKAFGVEERTLLDGVATQAVIAIENARLVEDLRHSRAQVLRADRLGTLGTLAAGLAHEINNPLVSIHTFLGLAAEKRNEDDEEFWGDYHRVAVQEAERIRGLVATMSRLGRSDGEKAARAPCDVVALANEAVTLLSREATACDVVLEVRGDPETPRLLAVRDQLHQLVLNLMWNAIHATPRGKLVEISVEPADLEGRPAVAIEVKDQGHGIPEDQIEQIFDPFFTTKGPDKGTGLGLMISHRIVTDHGGSIEVRSRPGEGATFRVLLPAEAPAVQAA